MYEGFCAKKTQHQGGSSTMSIDVTIARAQRLRMQALLRKTKSRIEGDIVVDRQPWNVVLGRVAQLRDAGQC